MSEVAGAVEDQASLVSAAQRWRAVFVTLWLGLLGVKLVLVLTLQPLGDEAFYWQESRHLALGYSDLPGLTAWLIALGEALAGHGVFGLRWPFLLLGSLLPWLMVAAGRQWFDRCAAWQGGVLSLCLPLLGSLGVLALPDVPLTFGAALALLGLLRALQRQDGLAWVCLGLGLALCWLAHYRAAMLLLAGLAVSLFTVQGRELWRKPGFWLALLIGACGALPLLISNWQQRGAGLSFQLLQRNPWHFHADTLVQPLEQAVVCTPLLYVVMLWAAWQCWRRRKQLPWGALAWVAVCFIVIYFVAGLFADDQRFRVHWPLQGYLPLLLALPVLLRDAPRWRRVAVWGSLLALACELGAMVLLGLATHRAMPGANAVPSALIGWRETADAIRALPSSTSTLPVVADNFMLAAELDFQFNGQRAVYALDSPLNRKYGRAPQLRIWQRDEAALRAQWAGQPVVLAVDEHALRERERGAWLSTLCSRITAPLPLQQVSVFNGHKIVGLYQGRVAAADAAPVSDESCPIWRRASSE